MTNMNELSGEERLRRRTRAKWILFAILFATGFLLGVGVARAEDLMGFTFEGPWPRMVALATLAVFLIAISIGTWFQQKQMDDYDRSIFYKSAALSAMVMLIGYPVWFLLWKAQLVPEPTHLEIIVIGYLALYAGQAFYRFR